MSTPRRWRGFISALHLDPFSAAGNVLDDDVVKPPTIEPPWALPLGFTVRSGETAPLNTYSDGSEMAPCWTTEGAFSGVGLISYQATSAPAPPRTV